MCVVCVCSPKEGHKWSQALIAETMEIGDKNRDVTDNIFRELFMFCEQSLEKINAFEPANNECSCEESSPYWRPCFKIPNCNSKLL